MELARAEVARALAELPSDLRAHAASLPVNYERVPTPAVVADGIEPDTLGLFIGGDFSHQDQEPIPAQIILYLENIWEMVDGDEKEFRREVRITFVHELGHFLGLDEDELDERGLL
jgi:predicted Zn-dependent protease with MMP-like domain